MEHTSDKCFLIVGSFAVVKFVQTKSEHNARLLSIEHLICFQLLSSRIGAHITIEDN